MTLSSSGYTTPTLQQIKEEIEAEIRLNISPSADLSASTPDGQLIDIISRQIRKVYEATTALYAASNPNGATGVQLDQLAALTGTVRRAATASRVSAAVNVDPGTYAAGSLVAHVVGNPDATFSNVEDVVNATGAAATIAIVLEATETGPVAAPSGTLTEISGPVSGWNSITNASAGTLGTNVETDAELRFRRNQAIEAQGSTTVDAIRADLINNIEELISVSVTEDTTAHSIQTVVYGPDPAAASDDEEVAAQIFASKPAGIATEGTTSVVVTDTQGVDHTIRFDRATDLDVETAITLEYLDDGTYPGDTEAEAQIAVLAAAALSVGQDFGWSQVAAWAMQIPGVLRLTDIEIGLSGGSLTSFASETVDFNEIAKLASADIAITSTVGVL